MGKAKQLSEAQRAQIITLSTNTSQTQQEIAITLRVSQSSVTRCIQQHKKTGLLGVKSRSGRPKKTSERTDAMIKREAVKDPFVTSTAVKQNLAPLCDNITTRTIRSRLTNKYSLKAHKPVSKPVVTAVMKKKRLAFCKKYRGWTKEQWRQVLFSDESTFQQFNDTHQYVRRPPGSSPVNPQYTKKSIKHSASIMVWGCFSHKGRGALTFLEKGQKMNSDLYISLMGDKLMHFMRSNECQYYQQDNAPCHTSKKSKEWFAANNIPLLDWPSNSPDLNPIENLWQIVKTKLSATKITSVDHLKQQIKQIWCTEISPDLCHKLSDSMPTRIEAVLKNKGYPSKY